MPRLTSLLHALPSVRPAAPLPAAPLPAAPLPAAPLPAGLAAPLPARPAARPAMAGLAAVLLALIALTAGCATANSTSSAGTVSTATQAAVTTTPSLSVSATTIQAPVTPVSPSAPLATDQVTGPAAPVVYLAESGSVGGTTPVKPACAAGCPLSGDGTTSLWNMTWPTWSTVQAVGHGTEKIDDCNPNCATGTLHAVTVRVALTKPVLVCVAAGTGKLFWTKVTFTWPDGLPSVFSGDNAPTNPFTYPEITAQQAKSCP